MPWLFSCSPSADGQLRRHKVSSSLQSCTLLRAGVIKSIPMPWFPKQNSPRQPAAGLCCAKKLSLQLLHLAAFSSCSFCFSLSKYEACGVARCLLTASALTLDFSRLPMGNSSFVGSRKPGNQVLYTCAWRWRSGIGVSKGLMVTQHFRAPREDFSKAVWNGVRAHLAHPNTASASRKWHSSHLLFLNEGQSPILCCASCNSTFAFMQYRWQGEGVGRSWRIGAAESQHPSCYWGRRHNICLWFPRTLFPAQCWQQHGTGGAQDGVSISHTDHEVSGIPTPFCSLTPIFLFSQPSLAGFLKGITLPSLGFKAGFNEFDEPV